MRQAIYEIIQPQDDLDVRITLINKERMDQAGFPPNAYDIPAHWHRSIEFSLVRKGCVHLWINNQLRMIHEGEYIFVNSAQIHQLEAEDINHCEVLLLIIPYAFLTHAFDHFDDIMFDFYNNSSVPPRIDEIFHSFYECLLHPQPFDKLKINALVFELLHILSTVYLVPAIDEEAILNQKMQHQLLDYMEEHYQEEISLTSLSQLTHFNPEYLSRRFKDLFGVNFKTYLTNYRLHACLKDVIYSNKSMQAIALDNGFPNVKSFISAFKAHYEQTPYQYRISHRSS